MHMSWLPTEFDSKLRCPSYSTVSSWPIKLAHIHLLVCKNPKTSKGVVVWIAFLHSKHTPFNMWKLTTLEIVILLLPFIQYTHSYLRCAEFQLFPVEWGCHFSNQSTPHWLCEGSHITAKTHPLDSISFQDEEDHIMRIYFPLHLILLADTYFMNLLIMYKSCN